MPLRSHLLVILLFTVSLWAWQPSTGLAAATMGPDLTTTVSPDSRWTAIVDASTGSLELQGPDGQTTPIFPPDSTINPFVSWSPDSHTLLVVRDNWTLKEPPGSGFQTSGPIEIWQVKIDRDQPQPATKIFQSEIVPVATDQDSTIEQIVLGHWSPNSRYVLFWQGPLGASILADGLPLFALDVQTGQTSPVVEEALLNPRYQSWSPDSTALAVTAGAGREAQNNKWLTIWEAATGQASTFISQTEQIPGIVAWSPLGDTLAYAAVPTDQTGDETYHVADFNNPAIAGRRIYLFNVATGRWRHLNPADTFQDAPLWSEDGATLYYVERHLDTLQVMAADPRTGEAQAVPGASAPLPQYAGYYGQSDLDGLLAYRPGGELEGQPGPTPAITPPAPTDLISEIPSPDGHWTALVNQTVGSLTLRRQADSQMMTVFSSGDTALTASWSPDNRRLLVVRANYLPPLPGETVQAINPIEIWQVMFKGDQPTQPTRLYRSAAAPEDGPQQIVLGHWSPDSRYILFWEGILSASILADGLPVSALEVTTGRVSPVAEVALLNPGYQSWSPDSTALAITAGGYRSAQVDKWLKLWNAASGQTTTLISQTEQVPGRVAWSPTGDMIAYAAVPAAQTGPEWADTGTFDNPAIAARRIYLLDPATGESRRLNEVEAFQDTPRWSKDGKTLYYVQEEGDKLKLMAANLATGQAETVLGAETPRPELVGYYGQLELEGLPALWPKGLGGDK